jgi:hypothetical protein
MKFPLHRTPAQGHPAKYCFAGTTMAGDSLHCSPAKAGVQFLVFLLLGPGSRAGARKGEL